MSTSNLVDKSWFLGQLIILSSGLFSFLFPLKMFKKVFPLLNLRLWWSTPGWHKRWRSHHGCSSPVPVHPEWSTNARSPGKWSLRLRSAPPWMYCVFGRCCLRLPSWWSKYLHAWVYEWRWTHIHSSPLAVWEQLRGHAKYFRHGWFIDNVINCVWF